MRSYDWPGYDGRALANRFMSRWHGRESALAAAVDKERGTYHDALRRGDYDTAVVWAGEAIDLISSIEHAGALVAQISADAESQLSRAAALCGTRR